MPNQFSHIKKNSIEKLPLVISHMKENNISLSEACDSLGLSYGSMYRAIKNTKEYGEIVTIKENGKKRRSIEAAKSKRKIQDKEIQNVIKMYFDEKKTLKEISKCYNTTASTVLHFLEKHGYQRRNTSEANKVLYDVRPELREVHRQNAYSGKTGYPRNENRESWCERVVREFFEKNNIMFEQEYQINENGHHYDFRIGNILVEVDGVHWHSSELQKQKDAMFEEIALTNGFEVIRITDRELKDKDVSVFFEGEKWKKIFQQCQMKN